MHDTLLVISLMGILGSGCQDPLTRTEPPASNTVPPEDAHCDPDSTSGSFQLPAHLVWTHWAFGADPVSTISFSLMIHDDPGSAVGFYVSPVNSKIDDAKFYLGLQTDMGSPDTGSVGKGILFSCFGTQDLSRVRKGPTSFSVALPDEGTFVSVRCPFAWTPGEYVFTLERKEAVGETDWFDVTVKRVVTGEATFLGGIRFPRKTPGTPAAITPTTLSFLEVYHGADLESATSRYSDVPSWHVSLTMSADGSPASAATSEYPDYPYAEYPNVDSYYADGRVHLIGGGRTVKLHAAGRLF